MSEKKTFSELLSVYMDAGLPILYVDTLENGKLRELLEEKAEHAQREIKVWSVHDGLRDYSEGGGVSKVSLAKALASELSEPDGLERKIFIIEDIADYFESREIVPEKREVISHLRHLAELLQKGEIGDCTIIILAPLVKIPPELEPYITLMTPDDMSVERIKERIRERAKENFADDPAPELLETFATSLRGLSETEIENILSLALVDDNRFDRNDLPMIQRQKQQMIKKSGILEMVALRDDETLDDIGGLENLKEWLKKKAKIFQEVQKARDFGVDIPKGVLIAGMPGCGKSLAAKAVAKTFEMPLLRMDMGRLMGKYVGESEGNMRRALQLTEASSPCVLWIDELEKAFAGVQAGGGGSEVTTRLFGSFLTWMQEKESQAFVVATANKIANLPPELLRKGRFDEIFYVDFPNDKEREKIFDIHIRKRRGNKQNMNEIDLKKLVSATSKKKYCGADLEGIVKDAIEAAFIAGKDKLTTDDILAAINRTSPISETMKDAIEAMAKAYKEKNFTNASA